MTKAAPTSVGLSLSWHSQMSHDFHVTVMALSCHVTVMWWSCDCTLVSPPPLVSGQSVPGPRLTRLPEEEVCLYSPGKAVLASIVTLMAPTNDAGPSTACFPTTLVTEGGHHWMSPESSGSFPLEYVNVNQFPNGYPPFGNPMGAPVNGDMDRQHGELDRQRGEMDRQRGKLDGQQPQGAPSALVTLSCPVRIATGTHATTGRAGEPASSSSDKQAPGRHPMQSINLPEHERVHFDAGQLCSVLYTPYSPLVLTVFYIHHSSYTLYCTLHTPQWHSVYDIQ